MGNHNDRLILIVEDNPDDILLLQRAFKKARIANPIYIAEDGEEAVAYLSGEGKYGNREDFPLPILVILDLKLPRKSGFEVLEWVREQKGLRRIPIVVLTSSSETTDINRAYDLGANSYLVKPVSFSSLLDLTTTLHIYWIILNEPPEIYTKVNHGKRS